MGICGAAFRFHFNPDWCPSAADVSTGFDVSKVLFKSLGYDCRLHAIDDSRLEDIQALYKEIVEQINRGIPIVAINLKEIPVWGVITGYLKSRPGIVCRTYFDESPQYSLAEHAPWLSFFIGDKGDPLKKTELFKNSLGIAAELANTPAFEQYYSGFNAIEKWIDELNRHSLLLKTGSFEEHEVNLTMIYNLMDARRAAVDYLVMMNLSQTISIDEKIIENYRKEVRLLEDLVRNVLPSYDSGQKEWTSDIISKQVDALTRLLRLEKETIVLIEEEFKTFVS
jgi:hypothetical protein